MLLNQFNGASLDQVGTRGLCGSCWTLNRKGTQEEGDKKRVLHAQVPYIGAFLVALTVKRTVRRKRRTRKRTETEMEAAVRR